MIFKKWFTIKDYPDEIMQEIKSAKANLRQAEFILTEQRKIINYEREQKDLAAKMIVAIVKSLDRIRIDDRIIQSLDLDNDKIENYYDDANRQTCLFYIDARKIH